MDVNDVISAAWRITLRHRGLWLLGLLAGTAAAQCTGGLPSPGVPPGPDGMSLEDLLGQLPPGAEAQALEIVRGLLIALAVVVVPIVVVFWLLSIACKAALIVGGREATLEQSASLGAAWRGGLRAFGRLFTLELLVGLLALLVVGVIGLAFVSASGGMQQPLNFERLLTLVFGGLALSALVSLGASLLSVLVAYAQRAVVLDQVGPIQGLQVAFGLARREPLLNLLLWVVSLAFSIAGAIGLVLGVLLVTLVALLVGFVLAIPFFLTGDAGPSVIISVTLAAIVAAIIVGVAILNTFMWHYWTLAYLRFVKSD